MKMKNVRSKNVQIIPKYITLILIIVLTTPIFLPTITVQANDPSIWNAEPKICWTLTTPKAWWLEGFSQGEPLSDWIQAADNLNEARQARSDTIINNYLSSIYVNDKNNTIFVGLKGIDDGIVNHILNIMNLSKEVTVKFTKGMVSLVELEDWEIKISSKLELLDTKNVQVLSCSKTVNGTILLGVKDLNQNKIDTIKEMFYGEVPMGILEIYNETPAQLTDTKITDKIRPLEDGIQLLKPPNIGASFGFVVTWGTNKGILSCA